ncbi:MAG: class I SAM-dependent methyltransferase [Candidatus Acidiferrales bacterium]
MTNKIEFSDVLSAVQKIHREYKERPIETKVAPEDDMVNADWDHQKTHYFAVGANAVEIILQSMTLCAVTSLASILDMPSGFGRVTRHLRAAFPEASLYASDLYRDRIDFCAQVLGTKAIKSEENLDEIVFPTKFDLIWCGSLLTHFAAPEFESALALFSRSLNVNGIAIVTLHGRYSLFVQHNRWKYLPDETFAIAESQFRAEGFGYADYGRPDQFFEQKQYGISLSAPSYALKRLESDDSLRIKGYAERHWDDHQDVLMFQKTSLNL